MNRLALTRRGANLAADQSGQIATHGSTTCSEASKFLLAVRRLADEDPGRWTRWLLTTHAQRHHRHFDMLLVRMARVFRGVSLRENPQAAVPEEEESVSGGYAMSDGAACRRRRVHDSAGFLF
jgi:hypothetical protein